jgi:hypothetical protein
LKVSPAKEQNGEPEETDPEDAALLLQIFDNNDVLGDSGEPNETEDGNPAEALINDEVDFLFG